MWADSLQLAEQQHLFRLFVWSEASILVGGLMLAVLLWRRLEWPMLRHFAMQTAAWGGVILIIAIVAWRQLAIRDHAAAVRLDRMVWLNIGLSLGYVAVGLALALLGRFGSRRPGLVGAGVAIILQGSVLAMLDFAFAQQIAR